MIEFLHLVRASLEREEVDGRYLWNVVDTVRVMKHKRDAELSELSLHPHACMANILCILISDIKAFSEFFELKNTSFTAIKCNIYFIACTCNQIQEIERLRVKKNSIYTFKQTNNFASQETRTEICKVIL